MRAPLTALSALLVFGLSACTDYDTPPPSSQVATPGVSDEALRQYFLRTTMERIGGIAAGCGGSQLADIPCRLIEAHGTREVQCLADRALALAAAVCPAAPPSNIANIPFPPVFTPPIDVFVPEVPPQVRIPPPPNNPDVPPPNLPNPDLPAAQPSPNFTPPTSPD